MILPPGKSQFFNDMSYPKIWNHPLLVGLRNSWKFPAYHIFGRMRVHGVLVKKEMLITHEILSFDGNREAVRAAQANPILNGCRDIEYRHGAVTSTDETSLAFRQDAHFWASNLSPNHVQGTTAIPAFNLDRILANFRPTCGNMDIEGGEYELLASEAWHSHPSLKWLMVEFHKTSSSNKSLSDKNELVKELTHLAEY